MSKAKSEAAVEAGAEVAAAATEVVSASTVSEAFPDIATEIQGFEVVDNTDAVEAVEEAPEAVETTLGSGFTKVDYV
jgi:hypothetical protein